ncbi:MAG: S41 family peptidase [Anaeromyxobacter sp.]
MNRPFRLSAILAATAALALGAAVSLAHADAAAAPTQPPAAPPAGGVRAAGPVAYDGPSARPPWYRTDGAGLNVFSAALWRVHDSYVDRSRFDARKMVVAALEAVEKTVAEVMVTGDDTSDRLVLTVGKARREIDISRVERDSLITMQEPIQEAMAFIRQNLVAHKDMSDVEYAAANGMLQTLDPHSVMMEPKQYKEMKLQMRGEFGGVGFVITMRDGKLTVVKVLKNTPAQRAGIKARDVITRIEEQSTVNMDLQDAVDRLRGTPNTPVTLVVQTGKGDPRPIRIRRDMINVETVSQAQLLPGNVGYVRLSQFSGTTARDLDQAINAQTSQAGGKLTGLVLDLRGNPGGLLEQAVEVSNLFISRGVIVKTVGSGHAQSINDVREADPDRADRTDLPLVVLVNNGSASASEIVAGALKNNNRALIVGRQTFGKGSVQVLYEYPALQQKRDEPAALKLTIAQYLTPGDISIQENRHHPRRAAAARPGREGADQLLRPAPLHRRGGPRRPPLEPLRHRRRPAAQARRAGGAGAALPAGGQAGEGQGPRRGRAAGRSRLAGDHARAAGGRGERGRSGPVRRGLPDQVRRRAAAPGPAGRRPPAAAQGGGEAGGGALRPGEGPHRAAAARAGRGLEPGEGRGRHAARGGDLDAAGGAHRGGRRDHELDAHRGEQGERPLPPAAGLVLLREQRAAGPARVRLRRRPPRRAAQLERAGEGAQGLLHAP